MIGKVAALKAAAAYGFACFAGYEVHERVVPAVKHYVAKRAEASRPHRPQPPKPPKIDTRTVCPPAVGITTLAEPLNYSRSLVPMDDDNVPATDEARDLPVESARAIGYGQIQPGGFGVYHPPGGGGGGGVLIPTKPVDKPTDEPTPIASVPEPATWLTVIVGMAAVGWAIRASKRKVRRGEVI